MDGMEPAPSTHAAEAYVGFWPRLGALFVDFLILAPSIPLQTWARAHYRMFWVWVMPWHLLIFAFYHVYLVGKFGGTPGKMILGIEIRKEGGSPVGYWAAFLRGLPEQLLTLIYSIAAACAMLHLSDAQYLALSVRARGAYFRTFNPALHLLIIIATLGWMLADIIVFFCNDKRRALHDFVAGTVVVKPSVSL